MRRLLLVLGLTATLLGGMATQAPPAAAYVQACTGDVVVATHTTAGGNDYVLKGHLCLEVYDESSTSLRVRTRAHWHCNRNNIDWDGCRVQSEILMERLISGSWTDVDPTNIANPGGSFSVSDPADWFANSSTSVSSGAWLGNGVTVRAKAEETDSVRFRLADNTTVIENMVDQAGPRTTVSLG